MHIKGKIIGPIGILIIILGVITTSSSFSELSEIDEFQYVEINNGTLLVNDSVTGFTIYIDYPLVDLNNNQIYDHCENIVITASHNGEWVSDYGTNYSVVQNPDPQREVFEYSSKSGNNRCWLNNGAELLTFEGRQLVQIGEACVGCLKGNTTIVAQDNVSMWIKAQGITSNAWAGVVVGFAMGCCGVCFGIFGLAGGITVGVQNPEHNVTVRKSTQKQQEVTIHQTGFDSKITSTMMTEPNYDSIEGAGVTKEEISPEQTKQNFWEKV
jgi:hypothetical protein